MKYKWILFLVLLGGLPQGAFAAKYVSDVLWVSLRDAASDGANSLSVLKSGTKLEVLDENEVEGYLHVKTSSGKEGWIKSRYLLDEPIAAMKVKLLLQQMESLTEENKALKVELAEFRKGNRETDKERKRMLSHNKKLEQENARLKQLAAEPARLEAENARLKASLEKTQTDYESLKQDIDASTYETERTWFITGAGVLFGGIVMGLILPHLRPRRRGTFR